MVTNAPPSSVFLLNDKFAPCLSNNVFPKNVPRPNPELEFNSIDLDFI